MLQVAHQGHIYFNPRSCTRSDEEDRKSIKS